MPHKITLTGKPVSPLRQKGSYLSFDMEEKGSPASPKVVKEKAKAEEKPKGPEGTEDFVSLKHIVVPEAFLNSYPNPEKTQQVIDYVKRTGYLDEPIIINRETKILSDGYRRYIVAEEEKMDVVPVAYEK